MARSARTIVITGVGARSPIGATARQTASAVRAGINRFAGWPGFSYSTDGDPGLIASALGPEHVAWPARRIELLRTPIHEALWTAGLARISRAKTSRAGLFAALPAADRAGLAGTAASPTELAGEVFSGWSRVPDTQLVAAAQLAGPLAIAAAAEQLRQGKVDVAVVAGADSFLDPSILAALLADDRLKTADASEGLIPGEAGAAIVLETLASAERRGAAPLAELGATSVRPNADLAQPSREAPIKGDGMTGVVRDVLATTDPAGIHCVFTDLNGERWRFLDWAMVETRCLGVLPRGWQLEHPADCLGDIGAATGLMHMVLAVRAFARGYAGGQEILICSATDSGGRAALTLRQGA